MRKNVASQVIGCSMVSASDGSAFTGAVTVYVTGDGGTQAAGSVGSGACTHEGNGFHTYAPAQAETDYAHVAFTFTGTGAIPATVQVYPSFPQTGDTFARLGAPAGASVSADVAAVKAETALIVADTNELQTDWVNGGRLDLLLDAVSLETTLTAMKGATFDGATDSLEALRNRGDSAWITATGFATPTNITAATGITLAAVTHTGAVIPTVTTLTGHTAQTGDSFARIGATGSGLTSLASAANLSTVAGYIDTEVASILAAVDTEVAAIKAKTDNLPAAPAAVGDIPTAAAVADAVWDEAIAGHAGAGSAGLALSGASAPSAATVADAVWDEVLSGHAGVGSTGAALSAAGGSGDPWSTALPGAYGAGTAGQIIGDYIDAAISGITAGSGLDAAGVRAAVGLASANLDTQLGAIVTDTGTDLPATLATIAGYLDTEISAIKAQTDLIPASPASTTNITAGTITTVTNLTNAPTSGDLTATMKTSIGTAVAASAVASVTGSVGGNVAGSVGSLATQARADVNAEVLDVLATDTVAELAAVPAATSSIRERIGWLFALARNKITQTGTTTTLRNDADAASIATSTTSDDATTGTRGEWT